MRRSRWPCEGSSRGGARRLALDGVVAFIQGTSVNGAPRSGRRQVAFRGGKTQVPKRATSGMRGRRRLIAAAEASRDVGALPIVDINVPRWDPSAWTSSKDDGPPGSTGTS